MPFSAATLWPLTITIWYFLKHPRQQMSSACVGVVPLSLGGTHYSYSDMGTHSWSKIKWALHCAEYFFPCLAGRVCPPAVSQLGLQKRQTDWWLTDTSKGGQATTGNISHRCTHAMWASLKNRSHALCATKQLSWALGNEDATEENSGKKRKRTRRRTVVRKWLGLLPQQLPSEYGMKQEQKLWSQGKKKSNCELIRRK